MLLTFVLSQTPDSMMRSGSEQPRYTHSDTHTHTDTDTNIDTHTHKDTHTHIHIHTHTHIANANKRKLCARLESFLLETASLLHLPCRRFWLLQILSEAVWHVSAGAHVSLQRLSQRKT